MGAARGDDVLHRSALSIDHHEQTPLDMADGLNARLSIVVPTIRSFERRPIEQPARQGEIETPFDQAGIAFSLTPGEFLNAVIYQ